MKSALLSFFLFLLSGNGLLFAQVDFSEFPENMQLYSRDKSDSALVEISGKILSSVYQRAVVKLFVDDKLLSSSGIDELSNGLDVNFQIPIRAQLKEYRFEFWLKKDNDSLLVKSADKVLCGDAFIIYGQSNAVSYANYWVLNDSISKKYTRNYIHYFLNSHDNDGWHDATFPEVGSLGKWFIKDFTEEIKVPILMINAALGGVDLKYLIQRNPEFLADVHTPYGLMLKRIYESKIKSIKGFIFLQGESESNTSLGDVNSYPIQFDEFKRNLKTDIPSIDRFYVYQLGVMNTHALWEAGKLREYKRQLSRVYDDISVIPATGIPYWHFDGLHYSLDGYGTLADWLFKGFLAFEQGIKEFETPDLQKIINQKEEKRLKLIFNQEVRVKDSLDFGYYKSRMKEHFYSGRKAGFVTSIEREGKNLYLYYDQLLSNKLTYLPGFFNDPEGKPYGGPFIKNRIGTPVLTFHDVEIQDEMASPIVDSSYKSLNSIGLIINREIAEECMECELEISQLTKHDLSYIKSFPSSELEIILNTLEFENLTDSSILILRYISPISESVSVAYSLKGEVYLDMDEDGIQDSWDNCKQKKNFEQSDFDGDGIGDVCDLDADGDMVPDSKDNCLLQINPSTPELLLEEEILLYSSLSANQYHWSVNGSYSETTNDNLYIVKNAAEYAVSIADIDGCNSLVSNALWIVPPIETVLSTQKEYKAVLYPTPTTNNINYRFSMDNIKKAELYTIEGQLRKRFTLKTSEGTLDLRDINGGTYLVVFYSKDDQLVSIQRIVKTN